MSSNLTIVAYSILSSPSTIKLLQEPSKGIPWWFWAIMGTALLILIWMLFNRPKEEDAGSESVTKQTESVLPPETPAAKPFDITEEEASYIPVAETSFFNTDETPPTPFLDAINDAPDEPIEYEEFVVERDDLTVIEGIGPKISKLLQQADIHTYAHLANANVEKLQVILASAGIFLTDPGTWPDQAKLAAEGRWDELRKLQNDLKGGRPEY